MEGDGRQVEAQQRPVLHDERVHSGAVKLHDEPFGGCEFAVVENRVERHVDFRAEEVRVVAQPPYVVHAVAGRRACAEVRAADIHGVCAVAYGLDAAVGIAGRRKQFDGAHISREG